MLLVNSRAKSIARYENRQLGDRLDLLARIFAQHEQTSDIGNNFSMIIVVDVIVCD